MKTLAYIAAQLGATLFRGYIRVASGQAGDALNRFNLKIHSVGKKWVMLKLDDRLELIEALDMALNKLGASLANCKTVEQMTILCNHYARLSAHYYNLTRGI